MVIATNSTITALIVPASGMATIIEELLEGLLVEVFVAIFLYGIATAQVYFYWMNFANDSVWIRSTVLLVWVLETVHTCMCVKMITQYTIVDFGDVPAVAHIIWSAGVTVMLAVLIAAMVQTFFIHRIWILSRRSKLITAIPAVLLFVRVVRLSQEQSPIRWSGGGPEQAVCQFLHGNVLNARKLRSRGEHSAQEYNSNSIELGPSRRQGTQTDHKTMKPIEIFQHTTNISDNTGGVVDETNSVAQLKVVRSSIELGETYQKPQSLV
ncbi:hypothetical protein BKA93DRAFT_827705 [Sparassis latifolia]